MENILPLSVISTLAKRMADSPISTMLWINALLAASNPLRGAFATKARTVLASKRTWRNAEEARICELILSGARQEHLLESELVMARVMDLAPAAEAAVQATNSFHVRGSGAQQRSVAFGASSHCRILARELFSARAWSPRTSSRQPPSRAKVVRSSLLSSGQRHALTLSSRLLVSAKTNC
jgi:hypothetical protein